jgi:hypothetical protein
LFAFCSFWPYIRIENTAAQHTPDIQEAVPVLPSFSRVWRLLCGARICISFDIAQQLQLSSCRVRPLRDPNGPKNYIPSTYKRTPGILTSAAVRALDDWAASRPYTLALSSLKGTVIGIDATYYLHQHLHHHSTREPLLIALGGLPFALRANIERELSALKELGIGVTFVFDGLQFGVEESQNRTRTESTRAESARAFEQAWDLYDQQQADQVVDAFSNAGEPDEQEIVRSYGTGC